MASFLFRINTILTLATVLAPAAVPNRCTRGERRDRGRTMSHAFRAISVGSGAPAVVPDPTGAEYVARVVGVSDGDTIRVLHDGREVRIRLHGIDCPESRQPFGTRAKQFTSDLVFGADVRVRVRDVDRYGRTVGEVLLDDGRIRNRELVVVGLAWWYRRYAPYDDKLLEREAREARRGRWADADAVAPWEWRRP